MGAEKGTLVIMTGGKPEVHEELMPVLMAMGSKAIHCGPDSMEPDNFGGLIATGSWDLGPQR
jgi:hypothetical protein